MGIIGWIVLGLLAGALAKLLLPGRDPGGLIVTMLLGVVGALLGGFLAAALFGVTISQRFFDLETWISAVVGAMLVLIIYRMVVGRR